MIDSVRDAVVVVDRDYRVRFWNAGAERTYGWPSEEAVGREVGEVIRLSNGEPLCRTLRELFSAESGYCAEIRCLDRAGGLVVVDCSCAAPCDGRGNCFTLSIHRDVSGRWRDRQRLHLFEAAIGNARDAILITRASREEHAFDYRIEYANRALCEQTGYTAEELADQPARTLFGPDDSGEIARMGEHVNKRLPLTATFLTRRKDGSCFWSEVSVVPLLDGAGICTHVVSIRRDISERRRIEEALRASEERFRIAAESASDVIYECDLSSGRLEFFGLSEAWLGYPPDELPRTFEEWHRLVHPEDRERVLENLATHVQNGQPLRQEYRMRRRDGLYSDRMVRGRVVRDASGRPCKWIGASVDITEHKRYEEALSRSEQRFRALIQNSADGIAVLDREGAVVFDSPAARRILGTADGERLGSSVFEWVYPDDLEAARACFEEIRRRPGETQRIELRGRHKDGSWRWLEAAGTNLLNEPSVEGIVLNYREVTERKRVEEALRDSERQYRELVENASDLIYSHDVHGNFLSINAAAEQATGYTREEAVRMNLVQVVAPEYLPAIQAANASAPAEDGPPTTMEIEIITKDGRRLAVEDRSRWVFRNGAPVRGEGIARDITQRKRAELLERDRRQALEMVAEHSALEAVLAHLAEMVRRQYPALAASVLLLREGRLYRAAAAGLPDGYGSREGFIGPTAASAGSAAYWAQTVTSGDIASDPLWDEYRDEALARGLRACTALPIFSGKGPVLGVLAAYAGEPHVPDKAERELLEAAARLASIAIEHRQLNDQLAFQARHEPLTGLPNRLLFEDRLQHALAHARRGRKSAALLFIDLDRFKLINDTLGHRAGDLVLQQVARRLETRLRASDTLARTGGDEFNVVLGDLEDRRRALIAAQRLLQALQQPFLVDGSEVFVSASIGISVFPRDAADAPTLLRNADYALYVAKSKGRNRFQFFTPRMSTVQRERLEMESGLHWALERGELSVVYQPQFELASGRMAGLEALLRWDHPRLGQIRPERFIPIAEETGLIAPISAWVLDEVCRQSRRWRRQGCAPVVVAVNVSPLQFARVDLTKRVAEKLSEYGLEPRWLELELTESLVMRNVEESTRQMTRLRGLGVSISIDDFGTGYSSLSHLQRLPIDNLKIDRIFVQGMSATPSSEPLVRAVVGLAHSLGMTATAEGVESEPQMRALESLECDKVQGYLLGRPRPAASMAGLLSSKLPVKAPGRR